MADPSLFPAKPAKMRRGPGRPFQKGRSGNPDGRPKLPPEVRERAQSYGAEMIDVLHSLATDTAQTGAVRVSAAVAVLDRGFGKPVAPIVAASTEMSLGDLIQASMVRHGQREASSVLIEHSTTDQRPSR